MYLCLFTEHKTPANPIPNANDEYKQSVSKICSIAVDVYHFASALLFSEQQINNKHRIGSNRGGLGAQHLHAHQSPSKSSSSIDSKSREQNYFMAAHCWHRINANIRSRLGFGRPYHPEFKYCISTEMR